MWSSWYYALASMLIYSLLSTMLSLLYLESMLTLHWPKPKIKCVKKLKINIRTNIINGYSILVYHTSLHPWLFMVLYLTNMWLTLANRIQAHVTQAEALKLLVLWAYHHAADHHALSCDTWNAATMWTSLYKPTEACSPTNSKNQQTNMSKATLRVNHIRLKLHETSKKHPAKPSLNCWPTGTEQVK